MKKITVVGCGIMGGALINAFMNAGNIVTIVDINEDSTKPYVARGAYYKKSLVEAFDSDFILFNLPTPKIVESVVKSCPKGSFEGKMIVDTTTSTPSDVKNLERLIKEDGGLFLDGKIECYPAEVGPDTGYLLYSGSKKVFDFVKDTLKALSPEPCFLGENTSAASIIDIGAVLDLHYGTFYSVLEGVALAMKYNYPVKDFMGQIKNFQPLLMEVVMRQITDAFTNFTGEFKDADEATLEIELGALKSVVNVLKQNGINSAFSDKMLEMMSATVENGYGKKNIVALMSEIMK